MSGLKKIRAQNGLDEDKTAENATEPHELPLDLWLSVVSFLDSFDLLLFSRCSTSALRCCLHPLIARPLLSRGAAGPNSIEPARSLLALTFLSRQSPALFLAVIEQISELTPFEDLALRQSVFWYVQAAKLAKFGIPRELYALAASWNIPQTIAAAWCDDLQTLKQMASDKTLEPNVHLQWPPDWYTGTPLCCVSDLDCARLLLDHGADVHADVRVRGDKSAVLVIHQCAQFCNSRKLELLLSTDAKRDINVLSSVGSTVYHALMQGPVDFMTLAVCPAKAALRRCVASDWKNSVLCLLQAKADATLTHEHDPMPLALLLDVWPAFVEDMGSADAVEVLKALLRSTHSDPHDLLMICKAANQVGRLLAQDPKSFGSDAAVVQTTIAAEFPDFIHQEWRREQSDSPSQIKADQTLPSPGLLLPGLLRVALDYLELDTDTDSEPDFD